MNINCCHMCKVASDDAHLFDIYDIKLCYNCICLYVRRQIAKRSKNNIATKNMYYARVGNKTFVFRNKQIALNLSTP